MASATRVGQRSGGHQVPTRQTPDHASGGGPDGGHRIRAAVHHVGAEGGVGGDGGEGLQRPASWVRPVQRHVGGGRPGQQHVGAHGAGGRARRPAADDPLLTTRTPRRVRVRSEETYPSGGRYAWARPSAVGIVAACCSIPPSSTPRSSSTTSGTHQRRRPGSAVAATSAGGRAGRTAGWTSPAPGRGPTGLVGSRQHGHTLAERGFTAGWVECWKSARDRTGT